MKFALEVAARLAAEIPGLTVQVDTTGRRGIQVIKGRYACPCGEISSFAQGILEFEYDALRDQSDRLVGLHVNHIKGMLRDRVRQEGNEPNF